MTTRRKTHYNTHYHQPRPALDACSSHYPARGCKQLQLNFSTDIVGRIVRLFRSGARQRYQTIFCLRRAAASAHQAQCECDQDDRRQKSGYAGNNERARGAALCDLRDAVGLLGAGLGNLGQHVVAGPRIRRGPRFRIHPASFPSTVEPQHRGGPGEVPVSVALFWGVASWANRGGTALRRQISAGANMRPKIVPLRNREFPSATSRNSHGPARRNNISANAQGVIRARQSAGSPARFARPTPQCSQPGGRSVRATADRRWA